MTTFVDNLLTKNNPQKKLKNIQFWKSYDNFKISCIN